MAIARRYRITPPFYAPTRWLSAGDVHQVSNRSCMGCHKAGTDFSFIWVDAVEQIVPIAP